MPGDLKFHHCGQTGLVLWLNEFGAHVIQDIECSVRRIISLFGNRLIRKEKIIANQAYASFESSISFHLKDFSQTYLIIILFIQYYKTIQSHHNIIIQQQMTTLRTTVRIGDLLDFSSPLVSSISPENEPLQPKGTVHHRPPHYTGPTKNNTNKKEMKIQQVKVEKKAEIEKCPNVLFRNGVICTPYRTPMKKGERPSDLKSELERRRNYRKVMMRRGRSTEEERKREKTHMSETRSNEGKSYNNEVKY